MTLAENWHDPSSVPRLLLDDTYAPITSEIGLIELAPTDAVDSYVAWQEHIAHMPGPERDVFARVAANLGVTIETHVGPEAPPEPPPLPADERAVDVRGVRGTLADALEALLPLSEVGHDRVLFAPTASGWTAYFDNCWRGTDAFPPMSYLAEQHACRALRIVAVSDDGHRFGAASLEVYGPAHTAWLNVERAVSAIDDGGIWRFSELGEPLPFERVERYRARRTRDRFSLELLAEYAGELGLRVFDDSFYVPADRATLVTHRARFERGRSYTLAEARIAAGIPAATALPATDWEERG